VRALALALGAPSAARIRRDGDLARDRLDHRSGV
jgi:hypothetical protein